MALGRFPPGTHDLSEATSPPATLSALERHYDTWGLSSDSAQPQGGSNMMWTTTDLSLLFASEGEQNSTTGLCGHYKGLYGLISLHPNNLSHQQTHQGSFSKCELDGGVHPGTLKPEPAR